MSLGYVFRLSVLCAALVVGVMTMPFERPNSELALKPEEDLDDLYHPSVADFKHQVGKRYAFPVDNFQEDSVNVFNIKSYSASEGDRDDIGHGRFDQDREKIVQRIADVLLLMSEREVSVNLQPEEDMDDLFHNNIPQAGPYPRHGDAAVPVDVPSQENYNGEPEVDLDFLFHK
ncbi:uncharacterized protein LOC142883630 isoform X2 [Nelusetta ayraudi]|uniref:uncharacterized protein LOC142883630 isoform X2 n=1 Tax=Nelusetta ayraudi TaxID=303726 RepID=UPI003F71226A